MPPQSGRGVMVRGHLVRVLHQEAHPYYGHYARDDVARPLGEVIAVLLRECAMNQPR